MVVRELVSVHLALYPLGMLLYPSAMVGLDHQATPVQSMGWGYLQSCKPLNMRSYLIKASS